MSTSLKSTLTGLAQTFATSVLDAIRQMSLDEILVETQGAGARRRLGAAPAASGMRGRPARSSGRLGRRSASDIAALVNRIVQVLDGAPKGLRAEQIRAELGLEAKELPRPLADALAARRITKTGQKRATTYFAKGAGGGAKTTARAVKAGRAKRAGKKRGGKSAGSSATSGGGGAGAKKRKRARAAPAAQTQSTNGAAAA